MSLKEMRASIEGHLDAMYADWIKERSIKESEIKIQSDILKSPEAKTDRSENAVYQIAKDRFSQLQLDMRSLSAKIDAYQMFKALEYRPSGVIQIGSIIKLHLVRDNADFVLLYVPEELGYSQCGAISGKSIVGSAILGKSKGDTVSVKTLSGTIDYIIKEVY